MPRRSLSLVRRPRKSASIVLSLALALLAFAPVGSGASPDPESEEVAWATTRKPVLVHKLFVATYVALSRSPDLERAFLVVRAESARKTWTRVSAVLLEIDGERSEISCELESAGIAVANPWSANPYADIDQGTSECEIDWELGESLLGSARVTIGFRLPDRVLDPKPLKAKHLARLGDLRASARDRAPDEAEEGRED